jgi:hypothetical protein
LVRFRCALLPLAKTPYREPPGAAGPGFEIVRVLSVHVPVTGAGTVTCPSTEDDGVFALHVVQLPPPRFTHPPTML